MTKTLIEQLKFEEGSVKKGALHIPYKDHLGYLTIGYGTLIDKNIGGLTEEEAEYLLQRRVKVTQDALKTKIYFWDRLTQNRKDALTNMAYQMGVPKFMGFKNMLKALENGHYELASEEALESRWARQTPNRANRVAAMIKNG